MTYILNKKDSAVFEKMLATLEKYQKDLGILSFGISLTTLEEVFIKYRRFISSIKD